MLLDFRISLKKYEYLYPKDKLPEAIPNSIFLAGPSIRSLDVESWRPEAISH